MKKSLEKRGQFSVIAALLVAVILVTAVIVTYATVRNLPFREYSETLSAIQEMNSAINRILDFAIGYYGSILQVTGNATYARTLTSDYLDTGFVYITHSHPDWNPSFNFSYPPSFSIRWFEPTSYSMANISVTYSLPGLGISDVKYEAVSILNVTILRAEDGQARVQVTRGKNQSDLTLGVNNFFFYSYNYSELAWNAVPTDTVMTCPNGYNLTIPSGVDETAFSLQVVDPRGVMVTSFFSTSRLPQYTYTFNWNETFYSNSTLTSDTIVVEALQNGTLRWLGQNLQNLTRTKPIPPLPVRCLRVNATTDDGESHEVPFQVEDWASHYRIPLGLSTNTTLFNSRNMLVFLVNHSVQNATLWWDGSDNAKQTPYAWENKYFTTDDPDNGIITNGILTLKIEDFSIIAQVGVATSTVEFMRINGEEPTYGAEPAYVIHHGVVRDIVQQEAEWRDGISDCPNLYSQIVLTLPANATYYTYELRTIFVNSTQPRIVSDLSPIQLSSGWIRSPLSAFTENGTSSGFPVVAETYMGDHDQFYNFSETVWAHHWSEYIKDDFGAGIMFPDNSNFNLYRFDEIANDKTGVLNVDTAYESTWITPSSVYDKCGESDDHPANEAIDDDPWTYWRHSSSCNHWITLDLGDTMSVTKIKIYQYPWQPERRWGQSDGVEVYVSDDPDDWGSAVWTGTLEEGGWQETEAFNAKGRYVKLYSRNASSSQRLYWVQVQTREELSEIEFDPVARFSASFTSPLDVTWFGAVVTFTEEYDPIYRVSDESGLWVTVEHPPTVKVS